MNAEKKEELRKKRAEYVKDKGEYLDFDHQYISGRFVAKMLGVSEKTLTTLAEIGEFELGRIAGRLIINRKSLLSYLDRVHFRGAEGKDSPPVYDSSGKVNPYLQLVGEMHAEVPKLKRLSVFIERISLPPHGRSLIRHCDIGTFYHYRIGTAYKMSEDDWQKNINLVEKEVLKNKRGRKPEIFKQLKSVSPSILLEDKKKSLEEKVANTAAPQNKEIALSIKAEQELYCFAEAVSASLGVSEKTLITLAQMGEFELGRIAGKIIIEKASLLSFLNRSHLVGTKGSGEPPAYDGSGKVKPFLSFVPRRHTEIPLLKKISEFTLRTDPPLDGRSFIQHCDSGTFYHYRIGTTYRLSEEDWTNSLRRITKLGDKTKSNRGRKDKTNLSSL